jgi:hypothetical protein
MYPGVSSNKGYCNYLCSGSMTCPNTNALLKTLSSNPTSFQCNSNFVEAYYACYSSLNDNKCK